MASGFATRISCFNERSNFFSICIQSCFIKYGMTTSQSDSPSLSVRFHCHKFHETFASVLPARIAAVHTVSLISSIARKTIRHISARNGRTIAEAATDQICQTSCRGYANSPRLAHARECSLTIAAVFSSQFCIVNERRPLLAWIAAPRWVKLVAIELWNQRRQQWHNSA